MALRVLLADESSTIKKVMQLSLQDFGVEVKSVPLGVDVVSVAQTFKPDLIFIDILLQKKNGYEVCADLKKEPALASIPVILMWSGFMDLDEEKSKASKADGRLEKPFDNQTLRSLVEKFVRKTTENPMKGFLKFPDLPQFVEEPKPLAPAKPLIPAAAPQNPLQSSIQAATKANPPPTEFNLAEMDSENEFDHFKQVPLGNKKGNESLESFKLNLNDLNMDAPLSDDGIQDSDFMVIPPGGNLEQTPAAPVKPLKNNKAPSLPADSGGLEDIVSRSVSQISHQMLEKAVQSQARDVLEVIAWKILPDMVEKVVREELNKLLRELEADANKSR